MLNGECCVAIQNSGLQRCMNVLDAPTEPAPTGVELWLNLGDAHHQAAQFSVSLVTSTPLLNLIPSITFGN